MSFPGGKVEPDDADIVATALREAQEEVGLIAEAAGVRVVGLLDEVWIPVSRFALMPVVAIAERSRCSSRHRRRSPGSSPHRSARSCPARRSRIVERTIRDWPLRYGAYPVATDEGDELLVWGADGPDPRPARGDPEHRLRPGKSGRTGNLRSP